LGYAFGGIVTHLKVAVVDHEHGLSAVKVRELCNAVAGGARTFETFDYSDEGHALADLRDGVIKGAMIILSNFLRVELEHACPRLHRDQAPPRLALMEDTPDTFVPAPLAGSMDGLIGTLGRPPATSRRLTGQPTLDVVEVYPYVPYVQYLLPGSIVMSVFMMV